MTEGMGMFFDETTGRDFDWNEFNKEMKRSRELTREKILENRIKALEAENKRLCEMNKRLHEMLYGRSHE